MDKYQMHIDRLNKANSIITDAMNFVSNDMDDIVKIIKDKEISQYKNDMEIQITTCNMVLTKNLATLQEVMTILYNLRTKVNKEK